MTEQINVGRLARDLRASEITVRRAQDSQRVTLSFPASSEMPVERFFGTEVLSHTEGAIVMDRIQSGAAPLLWNHDWDAPVGMVSGARIQGGRLYVDAQMFTTQRAQEVAAMVEQGLRNVSIGYEIEELKEDPVRHVFTATRWTPLEVSIVTVPADASVGIGRAQDAQAKPVRLVRAEVSPPAAKAAAQPKESIVDQEATAAAGENADREAQTAQRSAVPAPQGTPGNRALELERQRRKSIENLCRANAIDDTVRDHWIGTGLGIDDISNELLQIVEERGKSTNKSPAKLGLSDAETQRFSLFRAVRAVADKNWSNAGFELECSREIAKRLNKVPDPNRFFVPFEVQERAVPVTQGRSFMTADGRRNAAGAFARDLTAGTPNAGGYLVATNNVSFIELLRNRAVAYRMGARRLSGLQGNVTVPRQTGAATAYWLADEGTSITESQQTFGQMALSPKNVGAYTEISRQLMLQSSPDAEGIVTSDLAAVTALAYDVGVLRGSGNSGQPTGIVNTAGIGSVTGTNLAFAGILEFQTDVATANINPATGGYVTTHAVAAGLIQRVKYSNTASPIWEGNVWDGSVQGFPAMATNQMSSATMLFGDWSQVVVAEWGVLEVEVNPYANFQAGIIGVRAMVSMDCGLRYPAAFSYASSITFA